MQVGGGGGGKAGGVRVMGSTMAPDHGREMTSLAETMGNNAQFPTSCNFDLKFNFKAHYDTKAIV